MLMNYAARAKIRFSALFDGRLKAYGVDECTCPDLSTPTKRCLTDGRILIWVFADSEGYVCDMQQFISRPDRVMGAIAQAFRTDLVALGDPCDGEFADDQDANE